MTAMGTERFSQAMSAPIAPDSLAMFRVLFGALMVFATARFVSMGWVESILTQPGYHFTYTGFRWVEPLSSAPMYGVFLLMGLSALCLMLGIKARAAAALFFVLFTWTELIEKAAYLNHYYLVSLLSALLALVRTDQRLALWPEQGARRPAVAHLWLFRSQLMVVYAFASLAKWNADWLLRGEPLAIWLQAHHHLALVGPWLARREVAIMMSWAGMLFDACIWALILYPRTRRPALLVALAFHVSVWALFPIGVFSWVMLVSLTLFLPARWPERLSRVIHKAPLSPAAPEKPLSRYFMAFAIAWIIIQVLVPLRSLAYPGHVSWSEQGFRFSWRVMLIEKTGRLEYRVCSAPQRCDRVYPREQLTRLQHKMLVTQPDMILEYAHKLAGDADQPVSVFADSFVSLNARPAQRMIDPTIDLAAQPLDTWRAREWIVELRPRHDRSGSARSWHGK